MEELILEDMEDMIQKLKEIPWFENCQQSDAISKFDISYCNSVNSTIKHCSSIRWENLLLDKSEDISCHIIVNGIKTKYKWNDVVKTISKYILPKILNYVENKWIDKYEKNEKIRIEFNSVLMNFLLAHIFSKYKEEPFHDELLKIYEQGYFPCGWKGTYPEGKIIIF
ncbi:MAG: hypothetical protein N4A54_03570 [Peptostreptococcaceae bacterium]|jgi:hypothetical protein|nr:hypothetical protein [Peptostreptococcaceae bacterium]